MGPPHAGDSPTCPRWASSSWGVIVQLFLPWPRVPRLVTCSPAEPEVAVCLDMGTSYGPRGQGREMLPSFQSVRMQWRLQAPADRKTFASLSDILGNAYLSLYFNTGQNPKISQQALSAYAQAVSTVATTEARVSVSVVRGPSSSTGRGWRPPLCAGATFSPNNRSVRHHLQGRGVFELSSLLRALLTESRSLSPHVHLSSWEKSPR